MAVISHDYRNLDLLETIKIKHDGAPLHGEIDMYRRIYSIAKRVIRYGTLLKCQEQFLMLKSSI